MTVRELTALGLLTDPAPMGGDLPPGAMEKADDVVIRRRGLVESRQPYGAEHTSGYDNIHGTIPYDGDILVATSGAAKWESDGSDLEDEDSAALDLAPAYANRTPPTAEARANLYIGTTDGVHKVTGATAANTERAGIGSAPGLSINFESSQDNVAIETETAVAYRATVEREDANGVLVVSFPTPSIVMANHYSADRDTVFGYDTGRLQAGDVFRLYRSYPVASTASVSGYPSDDLYEVYAHVVTAADVAAEWVADYDVLPADDLGDLPLYTNPTRQSIARGNFPPPYCEAMSLYKGSMFYANTVGAASLRLRVTSGDDIQSGNVDGIGIRTTTADFTSGSAAIANIADTSGLEVGMIVRSTVVSGTPTTIVSIDTGAGTAVMSVTADSTSSTQSVSFDDTITINSSTYSASSLLSLWIRIDDAADEYGAGPIGVRMIVPGVGMRRELDVSDITRGIDTNDVEFLLMENNPDGTASPTTWNVYATHGDEYFEPLENIDGTATPLVRDTWPDAIYFSKTDQPEHVPLWNYIRVGSAAHPIQRIVSVRDAMWIFKTDGVYRLTGQGEASGWRVDAYDLSVSLIHQSYVAELDGDVFAWTPKGVISFGEHGSTPLSTARIGNLLAAHELDYGVDTRVTSDWAACWSNPRRHEVYFSNSASDFLYVFNTKTNTWTRWTNGYIAAGTAGTWGAGCWNPVDGLNWVGTIDGSGPGGYILKESQVDEPDIDGIVKWSDHTDAPGVGTRYQDAVLMWEDRTDLESYDVLFSSSNSATETTVARTGTDGTFPKPQRVHVPRRHMLTTRLGVEIQAPAVGGDGGIHRAWSISGLRVNSVPVSSVVER